MAKRRVEHRYRFCVQYRLWVLSVRDFEYTRRVQVSKVRLTYFRRVLSNACPLVFFRDQKTLPFLARSLAGVPMLQADGLLRPRVDWSVSAGSGITCTACEHEVKQLRGAARAC